MNTLVATCVIGILVLLPVQFLKLPFNMSLVEAWSAIALPLCWLALVRRRQLIRLPYLTVMLALLLATGIASLLSPDPVRSLLVLVREIYLYLWAITLAAVFEWADGRDYRRLLAVWCIVTCAHGLIILAQFVYPPLLAEMNARAAGLGMFDPYRPSGLAKNSNIAAVYQVGGFVPLALLRLRRGHTIALGGLLVASVLSTGSMGATVAVAGGLAVGLVVLAGYFKDWASAVRITIGATLAVGLLVGVFLALASTSPELNERLERLLYGRSERSASSRFALWNEGLDVALGEASLLGIGPDAFRLRSHSELHNDLLSFLVERGYLGALALVLFGVQLVARGISVLGASRALRARETVVFPAAAAAFLVNSLTHEIFHMRVLWLVLAAQEAVLWRSRRTAELTAWSPPAQAPGPGRSSSATSPTSAP